MTSAGNPTNASITWRITIQSLGAIMEKIHREYDYVKSQPPYHIWDRLLIFWRPVLETATLSTNSSSDLQAKQEIRQVFVTHQKLDLELTAAFLNPNLLSDAGDFARANNRFSLEPRAGRLEKDTLVVGLQMNWLGLFSLILANVIVCFGVGILVGFVTKRVDLGIAFTSGVAGVLACVQAILYRVCT